MKSTPRKYRLKSQHFDQRDSQSGSFIRRLSTQPSKQLSGYEQQIFYRHKSVIKKQVKFETTVPQKYFTLSPSSNSSPTQNIQNAKNQTKNQLNHFQNPNIHISGSMSTKSYDNVIGYGWACLKQRPGDKDQTHFCIQLGKCKNFVIVDCSLINGTHNSNAKNEKCKAKVSKQISQAYLLQIMKIQENFEKSIESADIVKAIQVTLNNKNLNNILVSITSAIIDQDNIHIISYGRNSIYLFTRQQKLILPFQNAQKQQIMRPHNAVRTTRYNKSPHMNINNFLSKSISSDYNSKPQKNQKIMVKSYKCSQIIWVCLLSKNITQNLNKDDKYKYLQDCINRQFSMSSRSYPYGEIAMESCKKIINDIITSMNGSYQPMTAIITILEKFPFQNKSKSPKKLWSQMKSITEEDIEDPQNIKPKMLKYIGNRRSFVKNTAVHSTIQKNKL